MHDARRRELIVKARQVAVGDTDAMHEDERRPADTAPVVVVRNAIPATRII